MAKYGGIMGIFGCQFLCCWLLFVLVVWPLGSIDYPPTIFSKPPRIISKPSKMNDNPIAINGKPLGISNNPLRINCHPAGIKATHLYEELWRNYREFWGICVSLEERPRNNLNTQHALRKMKRELDTVHFQETLYNLYKILRLCCKPQHQDKDIPVFDALGCQDRCHLRRTSLLCLNEETIKQRSAAKMLSTLQCIERR